MDEDTSKPKDQFVRNLDGVIRKAQQRELEASQAASQARSEAEAWRCYYQSLGDLKVSVEQWPETAFNNPAYATPVGSSNTMIRGMAEVVEDTDYSSHPLLVFQAHAAVLDQLMSDSTTILKTLEPISRGLDVPIVPEAVRRLEVYRERQGSPLRTEVRRLLGELEPAVRPPV